MRDARPSLPARSNGINKRRFEASILRSDSRKIATHANWKDGDDVVIVPSLQDPGGISAAISDSL